MKKLFTIIALALLTFTQAFAQTKTVTGTIKGSDGEVLVGATAVASSGDYAIADLDGRFELKVKQGDTFVCSSFGYDDVTVTVTNANEYNVVLPVAAATMLEEAVAIGYGTTTKKEVTGSVTSLKMEALDKGAFSDASGLLQGKVAGLSITNPNGGDPNGSMEILLRGTNTLSAGQGPLIIIDGVSGADLRTINFQEVETIDVLKDGSAAAIYGTRGTNGVIIITTRRAKAGATSVEYRGQAITQTLLSRAVPMTADEFEHAVLTYKNFDTPPLYGAKTDWFKEVTRTPFSHRHSLAIAGGSEKFSHRTTVNVEQNQGMLRNNDNKKYLFRTNIHQTALEGWMTFDYNMTYGKRKFNNTRSGIFRQAFYHNPTEPIYDETDEKNGYYMTVGGMDYYNPVAMLNERQSEYDVDDLAVNGRATLNILPIEGLKWDNFVSYGSKRSQYTDYKTKYYPGEQGLKGAAEISNTKETDFQYESTLQYSKHEDAHNFQAILGYTYEQQYYFESSLYNYDFDTDFFGVNNIGAGKALLTGNASMDSYKSSSRYIAFFGRAMYNYSDKYMASVSLRRDGSSRFGANHKWGWFPAVSLGWRVTEEDFMQDVKWLDEFKLRAGFGMTGNQDFGNYKSLFLVKTTGNFYYDGKWSTSYAPASNPNPDLAWEKKSEFNIGFDSRLFNKVNVTVDYYYRLTTNLLYNYTVPVPPYDYGTMFTNVGKISNSGIELTVDATPVKTKNLTWNTTVTASHNDNKLISFTNDEFAGVDYRIGWLNTPIGVYCQRLIPGESIGSFYGPHYLGLRSSGATKLEQTKEEDWIKLGSAYPWASIGWSNSLTWKNFTLNASLRASLGGKVFNQMRAVYENIKNLGGYNILASWLEEPEFTGGVVYSDKYLEDATYVKLDNVTLNYNVPLKNRTIIKDLDVYLAGQNLLVLTGYKGVDPEVSLTGLTPGIEGLSYYPRTRVFTFGVNVKF
ncbi:MAG: SusC/RagA family TonB-linked outer membrane protein [Bacteroidales bacterium]|nr:SusC/RagA family TonB-linked outer membrane protein [Bacteroidales bacterium]